METRDYFVSYTASDEEWARWLVWELEKAGYSCFVQFRDFVAGSDFITGMRAATEACRQTIALLSRDYFSSEFGTAEMQAALAKDPLGLHRALIPIRVKKCKPTDLIRGRIYIDLVGLNFNDARVKLVKGVAASRIGVRPVGSLPTDKSPKFPGSYSLAQPEHEDSQTDPLPPLKKLRVLFLGAENASGLNLTGQLKGMRQAVAETRNPQSIVFTAKLDITPTNLLPTIHKTNPHVCHFAGKQDGGNVVIGSDDGGVTVIPDDALEGLFQSLGTKLRMVVMDTCQSARCARAITNVVPFAMGVGGDIYDDDAISFYSNFYRAIANGYSLAECVAQAQSVNLMGSSAKSEIPELYTKQGQNASMSHLLGTPAKIRKVVVEKRRG